MKFRNTSVSLATTPLLASKIVFNGLSKEDQEAIREAAAEAGKFNREESKRADTELVKTLQDHGVIFNEIDKAPFVEKTKSVYDEWSEEYPELVELTISEASKK